MPSCKGCRGTGLTPLLDSGDPKKRQAHLFTEEECQVCGGRGRKGTADRPYDIQVYLNNSKLTRISVLGESAADALVRAAEMFEEAYGSVARPGDLLHLEVLEA